MDGEERASDAIAVKPEAHARPPLPMLVPHVEPTDGHHERGLELGGEPWHGPAHVIRAAGYCVEREAELLDRTAPDLAREADDACLGPRHDLVVSFVVGVVDCAPLQVARPFRAVGGWIPKAGDLLDVGFDVRAQRGADDGVSVEDEASEVAGNPFEHRFRLDLVGRDVNVLAACVRRPRHGVYGVTLLSCITSFSGGTLLKRFG
ncbi:hypothetical protein [Polyangium sp. 15x6]|uniref:hypothetical protein n=1 Tax=Polyangium sp. 15x6 TaxID=3042687 RepID=UPI002499C57E|nr:hypothetical protein [Polyangium sp. 15x6]MDI3288547.1 hypothetical protein [Polyangium sp. 15x6]